MADAVKALTHWRRNGRDLVRNEHTREIVKEGLNEGAKAALIRMASELDMSKARIARLERLLASLAAEALKDG